MRMLALLVAATLAGGAVAAPPASLVERLFKAEKLFKPAMKAAEKERPPFPSRWGEAATEHQPPTSFSFPERRLSPYPREPILSTEKGGEMWVLPVKPVLEP